MTDDVFTAWCTDRATGTDAIMLAPTRELVAELNQRARAHRLDTTGDTTPAANQQTRTVTLADGNLASVGDTVITRSNNRSLRIAATDWVKNGDRWQITALGPGGSVSVQHARNGRFVALPAAYVSASLELGYAATIHTAQGVTAEASHTLLTGAESRQLAYTAMTRGRQANHLYLQVVGDGDEHNVVRPDHTHPLTPTDLLEGILAPDGSSRSATTIRRDADNPATRLGDEAARYLDSLYAAAEHRLGPAQVARLDTAADQIVPDLTSAPAWPTLRAHLHLRSAHGLDPLQQLHTAATQRELHTAGDVAAVIDWRLDDTGLRSAGTGPLPWLPGIPEALTDDPEWGPYLAARAARVRDLSSQVAEQATHAVELPAWARQGQGRPPTDLLVDVALWRAATGVDPADRRPTGPTQIGKAANRWQTGLTARLAGNRTPALTEWADVFDRILTHPRREPFTPLLAERLSAISRAGLDAPAMIRRALTEGPLPDDHNAAALWWRIAGRLSPAVAAQAGTDHNLTTPWASRLPNLIGADHATALRESSWWPALVTVIDHPPSPEARTSRTCSPPTRQPPTTPTPAKPSCGASPCSPTRPPPPKSAIPGPTCTSHRPGRTTRSGTTTSSSRSGRPRSRHAQPCAPSTPTRRLSPTSMPPTPPRTSSTTRSCWTRPRSRCSWPGPPGLASSPGRCPPPTVRSTPSSPAPTTSTPHPSAPPGSCSSTRSPRPTTRHGSPVPGPRPT